MDYERKVKSRVIDYKRVIVYGEVRVYEIKKCTLKNETWFVVRYAGEDLQGFDTHEEAIEEIEWYGRRWKESRHF